MDIRNRVVGMITRQDLLPYNMQEKLAIVSNFAAAAARMNNNDGDEKDQEQTTDDESSIGPTIVVHAPEESEDEDMKGDKYQDKQNHKEIVQNHTTIWY